MTRHWIWFISRIVKSSCHMRRTYRSSYVCGRLIWMASPDPGVHDML